MCWGGEGREREKRGQAEILEDCLTELWRLARLKSVGKLAGWKLR